MKNVCYHCGEDATHFMKKSKKWCCSKSSNACPAVKERKRQSYLLKYGVESPTKSPEIQAKMRATNIQRYGAPYQVMTDSFKDKAQQTLMGNYGVSNPSQSDEVKERKKRTLLRNYGVESPMHSPEIRQRLVNTCRNNWGVDHPFLLPEFQERLRAVMVERYGVDNPFKDPERFKVHEGAIARFGKKGKGMVSDSETKWLNENEVLDRQKYVTGKSGKRYCVDGIAGEVVYEFLGIYWHGHPKYFSGFNKSTNCSFEALYLKTKDRILDIEMAGYAVVAMWEDGTPFTGKEDELG